ncbi:MAG: short-chain dehydrogenase/reductase [Actinomycetia bacterium]|nr:short-chain dehydrogenase/reductase [Actinomycetes bacterium]
MAVPAADNADATSDVDKVAAAIIASADIAPAPKRLALGSDAYAQIKAALTDRLSALNATKELSFATDKTAQV